MMSKSVNMTFLDSLLNFNSFEVFKGKDGEADFVDFSKLWNFLSKIDISILSEKKETSPLNGNQSIKDKNDKLVQCFHKFIDEFFEKMEIESKSCGIKDRSVGKFFKNFEEETKNWKIAKENSEYEEEFRVIKGFVSILYEQILNEKFIKELKTLGKNNNIESIELISEILEFLTNENKMNQIKFGCNFNSDIIEFTVNKIFGYPMFLAKIASFISPIFKYWIGVNQILDRFIKPYISEHPGLLRKGLILSSQLSTNSDFKLIDIIIFLNSLNLKKLIAKLKPLNFDQTIIVDDKEATKNNIQERIDQFQDSIEKIDAFKALFNELSLRMKISTENGGLKGLSIKEFIEKFEERTHDWESRRAYANILGEKDVAEFCNMLKSIYSKLTTEQKQNKSILDSVLDKLPDFIPLINLLNIHQLDEIGKRKQICDDKLNKIIENLRNLSSIEGLELKAAIDELSEKINSLKKTSYEKILLEDKDKLLEAKEKIKQEIDNKLQDLKKDGNEGNLKQKRIILNTAKNIFEESFGEKSFFSECLKEIFGSDQTENSEDK